MLAALRASSGPANPYWHRRHLYSFSPAITAHHISLSLQDELHLLHVVPDVFTSPASGSIYYCSSPDPETERLLVRAPGGC